MVGGVHPTGLMPINARTATAADFDAAAQKHANAFWFFLAVAGVTYYFLGWWATIPGVLVIWAGISSVSATKQAINLRNGTYRIPNPNNGAPDGDARNINNGQEARIDYGKDKRYEKIVNEYGKVLMEATELNKSKVEEFGKKIDGDSLKELQDKRAIFYHLQNKFDIRLLPYEKNTIKEAIESLMQDETDVNRIEQLKVGLLYLDDFIDFSA